MIYFSRIREHSFQSKNRRVRGPKRLVILGACGRILLTRKSEPRGAVISLKACAGIYNLLPGEVDRRSAGTIECRGKEIFTLTLRASVGALFDCVHIRTDEELDSGN